MKDKDGDEGQGEQEDSDKASTVGKKLVMSTLRYNIQVGGCGCVVSRVGD